jgi:hypothetical protein
MLGPDIEETEERFQLAEVAVDPAIVTLGSAAPDSASSVPDLPTCPDS